MIEIQEEKIPYRKKKDGDVSKANKKSKHKHIYDKTCVFEYQYKGWASVHYAGYTYCSICGKLGKHIPDTYMSKREDGTYYFWQKEDYEKAFPDALWIKLEKGKSFFNIDNINEVINNGLV